MTIAWLRSAAVVLAALAVVDPSVTVRRTVPVNVMLTSSPGASREELAAIRGQLSRELDGRVTFDGGAQSAAVVVVGDSLPADVVEQGRPLALVSPRPPGPPALEVSVADPLPTIAGWTTAVPSIVRGRGLAGRTSTIVLQHRGLEVARVEHRWTEEDERFDPGLTFVPPQPGVLDFTVVAGTSDGPGAVTDRAAARMLVEARVLQILVYEPRASWSTRFVRRALEEEPLFAVSALTGASRQVEVRAGTPPRRLDPRDLQRFDAVVAGAPEDLTAADVDALDWFVALRGGALMLLPDRVPSGPVLRLLPVRRFDEWLAREPERISASGASFSASEFAIPAALPRGVEALASIASQGSGQARDVVIAWPHGAGRVVLSGALDAWRGRGHGTGFADFWRGRVAAAAAAAPPALSVAASPGIAAPDDRVRVRARVRPTSLQATGPAVVTPEIRARVIAGDGGHRWIRLWPASEPGVFEGTFSAGSEGDYDVEASSSDGHEGHTVLRVRAGTSRRVGGDVDLDAAVRATGGVFAASGNLTSVAAFLRALPAGTQPRTIHPARSFWWAAAFVTLLCAEWALRRRAGSA